MPNNMGYDMEMGRDSFKGPVERSDISHFMGQECKGSHNDQVPLSTHPDYAFLSNSVADSKNLRCFFVCFLSLRQKWETGIKDLEGWDYHGY